MRRNISFSIWRLGISIALYLFVFGSLLFEWSYADNQPILAFLSIDATEILVEDRNKIYDDIYKKIIASTYFRVIDRKHLSKLFEQGKVDHLTPLNVAHEMIQKASQSYKNLMVDDAIASLLTARRLIYQNPLATTEDFVKVNLLLGNSYYVKGDRQTAENYFSYAILSKPELELNTVDSSPDLKQAFSQVKERLNQMEKGELEVVSEPSSAELFLNGKKYGVTPAHLTGLMPGDYSLMLKLPRYKEWIQDLQIIGAQTTSLSITLKPFLSGNELIALKREAHGKSDKEKIEFGIDVGELVNADNVLVVDVEVFGLKYILSTFLIDIRSKKKLSQWETSFDLTLSEAELEQKVSTLVQQIIEISNSNILQSQQRSGPSKVDTQQFGDDAILQPIPLQKQKRGCMGLI